MCCVKSTFEYKSHETIIHELIAIRWCVRVSDGFDRYLVLGVEVSIHWSVNDIAKILNTVILNAFIYLVEND